MSLYIHPNAVSSRFHSFCIDEEEGDVIYILPFYFSSIEELVEITDQDVQDFLYTELCAGDEVLSGHTGFICVGSDIHDHL